MKSPSDGLWAVIDPNLRKYPVSGGAESKTISMKVVFFALWPTQGEQSMHVF